MSEEKKPTQSTNIPLLSYRKSEHKTGFKVLIFRTTLSEKSERAGFFVFQPQMLIEMVKFIPDLEKSKNFKNLSQFRTKLV